VHPARSDLSSLRILGSVGEPINPEAWMWYHKNVGGERCPIVDTFWQTETGGHVITPLPGATPLVPGSCTLPLPGIKAAIVDEMGNDVPNGSGGILVIKRPWPSMIRTIWNDPERFKKSYFPEELKGYYLAGDGAVRSEDRGYFRITGRIDDVLNVSGHRMGTMEIESALVAKTDLVAEAAVVGRPDDLTGEAICAFVVLKRGKPTGEEARQIATDLRNWVAKEIGPIATPEDARWILGQCPELHGFYGASSIVVEQNSCAPDGAPEGPATLLEVDCADAISTCAERGQTGAATSTGSCTRT
jgi:acetyl-CoA synthetase